MRFFIVVLILLITCCSSENKDRYEIAINYITNDKNLLPNLYADWWADSALIYQDGQMLYRVYPKRLNGFFLNFRNTIKQNHPEFNIDIANVDNRLELEMIIDSSLVKYTTSDTAHIKIFFSEFKHNLLSADVFYRRHNYFKKGADPYLVNSRVNTAGQYLFVFEGNNLDTVYIDVQQYE